MKIDASELKSEGKEVIQNLADFIKNKTRADVNVESRIINASIENGEISKKYLRVLVKKFLHKSELKEYYRVISGNEDTLRVKEKKVYEE
ncbi:MAG: 60S ribosomal protein L22 [Candidatus Bathyarchaeota archaeon]|nr:60S ribosomal protein L22 [Candidatus Bathyarchaeota archaeon]